MSEFWQTTVEFTVDNGKNKPKKVREQFLVKAQGATEAEANTYKLLEGEEDFAVVGAVKSRIKAVMLEVLE